MENRLIKEISEWFIVNKAPDLKEKVDSGLKVIDSGQPLDENYRKLFGFMIFSHAMNYGPLYFLTMEEVAEKIGVTEELKYYAKDWIGYSQKKLLTQLNK